VAILSNSRLFSDSTAPCRSTPMGQATEQHADTIQGHGPRDGRGAVAHLDSCASRKRIFGRHRWRASLFRSRSSCSRMRRPCHDRACAGPTVMKDVSHTCVVPKRVTHPCDKRTRVSHLRCASVVGKTKPHWRGPDVGRAVDHELVILGCFRCAVLQRTMVGVVGDIRSTRFHATP
jgi:hypothetical protein